MMQNLVDQSACHIVAIVIAVKCFMLQAQEVNICIPFLEPIPTESPYGPCPSGFDDLGHNEFCYTVQVIF